MIPIWVRSNSSLGFLLPGPHLDGPPRAPHGWALSSTVDLRVEEEDPWDESVHIRQLGGGGTGPTQGTETACPKICGTKRL